MTSQEEKKRSKQLFPVMVDSQSTLALPSEKREEETPATATATPAASAPESSAGAAAAAATAAMAELTVDDFAWLEEDDFNETEMWVFGYGSLCWHQGFTFEKSMTGYIRGFSRKFWQGNATHRGTQKKPGRVATLVEDEDGIVWGQAFQVKEKEAFSYLNNRECELGGYLTTITTFYPRQSGKSEKPVKPFPVILYIATSSNRYWLGDSPLPDIANQIVECTGNSGHNVEYLLRLALFIRENVPEAVDDHLFTLERLVRSLIEQRKLCLKTLMGEGKDGRQVEPGELLQRQPEVAAGPAPAVARVDYTSTVTPKKLRCVNIC